MPNSRIFLDIDIGSHRAKYERARAFVEATDLRYGFTSKEIAELGGGEKQRIYELYENDFEWSGKGPIVIEPAEEERLTVELYDDKAPLAVENFKALCTGERGMSKNCGVRYHYKGVRFHRVVRGFMMQGGDFAMQNGSGGESVWGKKFKDEKDGLKLKHDARGVLSMGNTGKHSNGAQFFLTFAPCKALDGKHVVFGRVVAGWEVLDKVEAAAVAPGGVSEEPTVPIVVADCGLL
uniref:Peptidyl-prolyl cis-trans isomerase n=1 Tax=Mantoniella antarctica TaxID=81844 RepID=A0A7S0XFP6_9CHLO